MYIRSRASARSRCSRAGVGSRALIVVTASMAMIVAAAGTASAQAPGPASNGGKASNVIVVLRNQHTNLSLTRGSKSSPRTNAYRTDQAPVIAKAKNDGAKNLHGFSTVNAVAATVTPAQAQSLAADPAVAAVYPDLPIKGAPTVAESPTSSASGSPTADVRSGAICPTDPSKPLLEPEALQITNTAFTDSSTPQAQSIVTGAGVKVAFIADGVDIDNPDFVRSDGSHVFIDYQDFSGEGPNAPSDAAEAFGDASAIAAQGLHTYDLSTFVNPAHPLPSGCTIQIRGMAPGASLIGLKVFGNANVAPTSRFIEAIDYAVTAGADVLNESFGGNPYPDSGTDPITLADASAIAAGVTVVASTGDAGPNGTVGSPASDDIGIIGVAASTQFRSYLQTTYAGAQLATGTSWVDNNMSGLSSGGISQSGRTPDLTAPGDLGWALCTPNTAIYTGCTSDGGQPSSIQDFGGTSQSSPLTAGAAALVIQAYRGTHGGAGPSPALVRQILTSTATDLGHPAYEQGAGELNALKAVQAAQSWRDANGKPAGTGSALVVDKTQLFSAAYPYSPVAQTETVTNVGSVPQRVTAATRTLGRTVSDTNGTAALNTATASYYVDSFGIKRSYATVRFTVAQGVDRLTMYAAAATAPAASRIILIDPNGAYTAYSIPQGAANAAQADVRYPAAGTWTAYLALSTSSGFNGTMTWRVLQQNYVPAGIVLPSSFTLAPGASRRVAIVGLEQGQPGDRSASVQFTGSVSGVTSVPFSLRAVVPPWNYSFTGTILGGNGRGLVGQAELYYLDVPRGRHSLGVGIKLGDPGNTVLATLTSPSGQSYSYNSNVTKDGTGSGLQDYVNNPAPGRWVLSVQILDPVSGAFTSSPYQVLVRYDSVSANAPGLPTSTGTLLTAGVPVTIPVTITNSSVKPLSYFVDPRLDETGTLTLADLTTPTTIPLPQPATVVPLWLVPTHVSSLTLTATADQPVNVDFYWQGGNPDGYQAASGGNTGNTTSVTMTGSPLTQGLWSTDIGQTGPFSGPAPAGSLTTTVTATGQLFDPSVTSAAADFWASGLAGHSSALPRSGLDAVVQRLTARRTGASWWSPSPGSGSADGAGSTPPQSTTINVTITPTGAKGSQVRGTLYIGSYDGITDNADELIGLPYAYTVG
ncbi:MAG: protease inhibitor I9 family protein [Actinobacteria bacterium]|nr:protease inhibitor I9 family protein [Actinomycetota bacterium]